MKTLGDHPMLVGELLARAEAREKRQFRRRNRIRRICLTLLEEGFPLTLLLIVFGLVVAILIEFLR